MISRLRACFLSVAVLTCFACGAQKSPQREAEAIASPLRGGAELYRRYCGACHGLEGKGDGIVSSLMTPKPRDLTTLTRDFGKFPYQWAIRVIDGRETVRAHGESDMPVWGATLTGELGADAEVRESIATIVEYLASIQVD